MWWILLLVALWPGLFSFIGLLVFVAIMEFWTRKSYGIDVYQRERLIALARDNYLCQARLPGCEGRGYITHHVNPRHCGGPDTADNLMTVCGHCHPLVEPQDCGIL